MTVLVTGAAGRLGRAVVAGFAERGQVVALDRTVGPDRFVNGVAVGHV